MKAIPIERLKADYPSLSVLDLHYFAMKCYGLRDRFSPKGRPSLNLIDPESLYHITFATDEDSPYMLDGQTLLYLGNPLPFRVDFVERIPVRVRRYFYIRNIRYMTPTLYDRLILNLNFQHTCLQCGFCQNLVCSSKTNISEKKGFELIMSRGDIASLADFHQISIVTGNYGSGEKAFQHVTKIIEIAAQYGFRGIIFYIGYELSDPKHIRQLLSKIYGSGLSGFRMSYTVEMFCNRKRLLSGCKGKGNLDDIEKTIRQLRDSGVTDLQYSYMPGLDNLDDFKRGAERLAPLVEPHISIYRQFRQEDRAKHISLDYNKLGPAYLYEIRIFYEALYRRKLYGDNLGNIFPFPISMINKQWLEGKIVGDVPNLRYWQGSPRPAGWRVIH